MHLKYSIILDYLFIYFWRNMHFYAAKFAMQVLRILKEYMNSKIQFQIYHISQRCGSSMISRKRVNSLHWKVLCPSSWNCYPLLSFTSLLNFWYWFPFAKRGRFLSPNYVGYEKAWDGRIEINKVKRDCSQILIPMNLNLNTWMFWPKIML